ncbi:MAG: Ig-like domain repeat protein [Candidatus Solibacter sp.]
MKLRIAHTHYLVLLFVTMTLLTPGVAFAQVGTGSQLTCTVNAPVAPNLRSEGNTERVGDIAISCSGGLAPVLGAPIPTVNIAVFFNTTVTSRLLPVEGVSNQISEALLLIDEPGSGLPPAVPGFGSAAPLSVCATPLTGCLEYVSRPAGSSIAVATDTPQGTAATTPGKNVFQGVVAGNSVVFYGVPVLAPGSGTRVFRITNVRLNANALAIADDSAAPVPASLSISPGLLWLSSATATVAVVANSLAASVGSPVACGACTSVTVNPLATLSFQEKYVNALKTRVMAVDNIAYAGQNGTPGSNGFAAQNIPGLVFESESGFVTPVGAGQTAGLAESGTRLRALFNNIPAGVRLLVSVVNLDANGLPVAAPAVPGGSAANIGNTGYARLTSTETGAFNAVAAQGTLGPGGIPLQEITVANGSAAAVWEVINTNPHAIENLRFEVFTYSPSGNSVDGIAANLSYAPAPPSVPAGSSAQASAELPIPRFAADAAAARPFNLPNLRLTKQHTGAFTQGQLGAVYQLTVANDSPWSTDGSAVTVTDTMPSGMAATAISGAGWTCTLGTLSCTRSGVLAGGASYPAITVTVNIAVNAGSPLVNHSSVNGGGSAAASVDDVTTIQSDGVNTGSVGPNWMEINCPNQAIAGSFVSCSVSLRVSSTELDAYGFSATVTPRGVAPGLTTGQLSFTDWMGGAVKATDGTRDSINVSWTNAPVGYTLALGTIGFAMPAAALPGQAYTFTITRANASSHGSPVAISAGLPAIIAIPAPGRPSCNSNVTVTPALRAEGQTEMTGQITVFCNGGTAPEVGSGIPQADFTISYNVPVTSRLLPQAGVPNASEALLIIDEPGSGLSPVVPGFGPAAPQGLCATPATGCIEYVSTREGSTVPVATDTPQGSSATTPGKNVFQGVVSGNSVTFYGVPVLPHADGGARVFRVVNVRVNASVMQPELYGGSPVKFTVSMTGSAVLNFPEMAVGFVTPGMSSSATAAGTLSQCSSQTLTPAGRLSFSENRVTSFKTRVQATANTAYAGQSGTPAQNVPGAIYNSESDFVLPVATGQTAGLSDFGTRLKAQFQVPAGVHVFVSVANVQNFGLPAAAPAVVGGSAANANQAGAYLGYAQLTVSETGAFSAVPSTASAGSVQVVELPVTNGVATAVWEVINTNPSTPDSMQFGVFTSYTSDPAQNLPAPGVTAVNLSLASAPPGFSSVAGAAASGTLPVPRFLADSSSATSLFSISSCVPTVPPEPPVPTVAPTATALDVSPMGGANQFSLTATVTTAVSGVGNPVGTVTFYDNASAIGGSTTTLTPAATATVLTSLAAGSHRITAIFTPAGAPFTGSASPEVLVSFGKTSATMEITSNRYPSFAGQAVTFTAEVTGVSTPTGSVQFADGSQPLGSATMVGGRASVTATLTTVGVHDIFATYAGDVRNGEVSARFGQRVERVIDTLGLASSALSVNFGQPVTLTATLGPQAPPSVAAATGTVQFQEGTAVIGTAPLAAGVAKLTLANLLPGAHKIFAQYSGDTSWYGSRSEAVTVTVGIAAVTVTLIPAATMAGIEFSAALTPAMSAGSVEFVDTTDGTTLGSGRPASGPVGLAIAAGDAAKIAGHTIKAVYSGSGGFAGGTSNLVVLPALRNSAGGDSLTFAPDELVTLFGSQLGDAPQAAEANALPRTLGGLRVNVTDASGAVLASEMTYVSVSQINFIIPPGVANGAALVTVLRNGVVIAAIPVKLGRVAPGVFGSPQIARTPAGDVYLVLYATGIRNASGRSGVTCTVTGRSLAVAFAGPQGDFAGLDQVNVLLPADLRGTLSVSLTVDGVTSNSVSVSVQ